MSPPPDRAANPWTGTIGNTTICYRATREEAQAACEASRLEGLVFVTHAATLEKWIRDPTTRLWRPFKPTARALKERRAEREGSPPWWLD